MTGPTDERPLPAGYGHSQDNSLEWLDNQGRRWRIDLPPDRVVLRGEDDVLELSRDAWARDIYIAPHGGGYIVRFETFDLSVGFALPADQALPLIGHIGARLAREERPAIPEDEPRSAQPLLWPKVSPLAVWALICSALAFVPVLGLLPAVATAVLLLAHGRRVRRARAWSHSRALCTAALVFLIAGLMVSAVSTIVLVRNVGDVLRYETYPEEEPPELQQGSSIHTAQLVGWGDTGWLENVNWGLLVAGLFVVLASLTFHEAGHAITAWWLGDDFARRMGRATLNPLAHIDPIGTVIFPLILFLAGVGVFGWAKPVPVRTEVLDRPRRGHILISLAGPGANLLLAAASLMLLLGLGGVVGFLAPEAVVTSYALPDPFTPVTASGFPLSTFFGALCTILKLSFFINVLLAFFNLIPIPPLDGSWVLEHLFPFTLGPVYQRIRPYGFLLFLGLLYTGVLQYLLLPVALVILPGFLLLEFCTVF